MTMIRYQQQLGITLIELLITIAIVAILISVAAPNFAALTNDNRLTNQLNILQSSIHLARSEAVSRNINVSLCSSDGNIPAGCAAPNNGVTDYNNGWLIIDNNGIVLHQYPAIDPATTLNSAGNIITYNSRGIVTTPAMTIRHCDSRGVNFAIATNINAIGLVQLATDTDADNVVNDSANNNIVCP